MRTINQYHNNALRARDNEKKPEISDPSKVKIDSKPQRDRNCPFVNVFSSNRSWMIMNNKENRGWRASKLLFLINYVYKVTDG